MNDIFKNNKTFLWGMVAGAIALHLVKNTTINVNPFLTTPKIKTLGKGMRYT